VPHAGAKALRRALHLADDAIGGGDLSTGVDSEREERPSRSGRPSRGEIEPAALGLVRRHGAQIMATARRYALTPEDAEDAYQRGLEILLTKAPTTREDDLVPWLKTVVKHEAFALRRQRERHGVPTEHDALAAAPVGDAHEHVARLDQLQRGAEAMQRLKPQEMRCLLLLAEGHSYREICAITGFSYTKVNRCLAEGRLSFLRRVDGIEAGAECERLAPLVSAAADGEASADDMLAVRRHLRGCLACRAALREARSVPARVAALAPVGVVLVPHGGTAEAAVAGGPLHGAWNWLHERLSMLALRGHEALELAAAHKTVAVAASAAALAGGGAAAIHAVDAHAPAQARAHRAAALTRTAPAPAMAPRREPPRPAASPRPASRPSRPRPRGVRKLAPPRPDPSPATGASTATQSAPAVPPATRPSAQPQPQPQRSYNPAPETGHAGDRTGAATGEFAP
jgi:RNA polymerase sigma factor (sigma-70 family)